MNTSKLGLETLEANLAKRFRRQSSSGPSLEREVRGLLDHRAGRQLALADLDPPALAEV